MLAAVWLALLIPLSANAIDIETPAVGLAGVPLDYTVTGVAAGQSVHLAIDERTWTSYADAQGNAAFEGVELTGTGTVKLTAIAGSASGVSFMSSSAPRSPEA